MLDANLIKFVEPIGPGQIIDRESLVALPVGQIQITVESTQQEVTVRVLQMRGDDLFPSCDTSMMNWSVSAYIWQNGQVLAAERVFTRPLLTHSKTMPRLLTSARRRINTISRQFRFPREKAQNETDNTVVDAVLQICVYKSPGGAVQRKTFIGTVHIALNYLTSGEFYTASDKIVCQQEWYKIFAKSSFLPGCPSSIAKSNCAIASTARVDSEEKAPETQEATTSINTPISRTLSRVSFSQYSLNKTKSNSSSSIRSEPQEESLQRTNTDPNPKISYAIASWVRKKIFRQASAPVARQRTPDSAKCIEVHDIAPVIVGPRRKLRYSFSAPSGHTEVPNGISTTSDSLDTKTDLLPIPEQQQNPNNTIKVKHLRYRASRSNNSSFDVGYESSRSRCLSSSDEDNLHRTEESNMNTQVALVHRTNDDEPDEPIHNETPDPVSSVDESVTPTTSKISTSQKRRTSVLKRSKRISEDGGFTSLHEIHRQASRGSQDSAVFENS